eukprot:1968344-Pleurochrysis_carterae.AAC.2
MLCSGGRAQCPPEARSSLTVLTDYDSPLKLYEVGRQWTTHFSSLLRRSEARVWVSPVRRPVT